MFAAWCSQLYNSRVGSFDPSGSKRGREDKEDQTEAADDGKPCPRAPKKVPQKKPAIKGEAAEKENDENGEAAEEEAQHEAKEEEEKEAGEGEEEAVVDDDQVIEAGDSKDVD